MTQKTFENYSFLSQFHGLEAVIRETDEPKHVDFLIAVITDGESEYLLHADNSEHDGYEDIAGQGAIDLQKSQVELVLKAAYIRDDLRHSNATFENTQYRIIAEPCEDWSTPEWNELVQYLDWETIVKGEYGTKLVLTPKNSSSLLIHYKKMELSPDVVS